MWTRLGWAMISMLLINFFPQSGITNSYFFLVVACTVGSSFSRYVYCLILVYRVFRSTHLESPFDSTVQFVGISAFHTQIADPLIGGTYMTVSRRTKLSYEFSKQMTDAILERFIATEYCQ